MNDVLTILANGFWCGIAALGFGYLFNAPARVLPYVWGGGCMAGLIKFGLMYSPVASGIVMASFAAATGVGIVSLAVAHRSHVPPIVFSIPSVIPMVPGAFAYKTMFGMLKLAGSLGDDAPQILARMVHYGSITLFIVLALAFGVAIPLHFFREQSVKNLRNIRRNPASIRVF